MEIKITNSCIHPVRMDLYLAKHLAAIIYGRWRNAGYSSIMRVSSGFIPIYNSFQVKDPIGDIACSILRGVKYIPDDKGIPFPEDLLMRRRRDNVRSA